VIVVSPELGFRGAENRPPGLALYGKIIERAERHFRVLTSGVAASKFL
jgi:hypothetical protein